MLNFDFDKQATALTVPLPVVKPRSAYPFRGGGWGGEIHHFGVMFDVSSMSSLQKLLTTSE